MIWKPKLASFAHACTLQCLVQGLVCDRFLQYLTNTWVDEWMNENCAKGAKIWMRTLGLRKRETVSSHRGILCPLQRTRVLGSWNKQSNASQVWKWLAFFLCTQLALLIWRSQGLDLGAPCDLQHPPSDVSSGTTRGDQALGRMSQGLSVVRSFSTHSSEGVGWFQKSRWIKALNAYLLSPSSHCQSLITHYF